MEFPYTEMMMLVLICWKMFSAPTKKIILEPNKKIILALNKKIILAPIKKIILSPKKDNPCANNCRTTFTKNNL